MSPEAATLAAEIIFVFTVAWGFNFIYHLIRESKYL